MASTILPCSFCTPVGESNDCICTSSSLTTPPVPSFIIWLVTSDGCAAATERAGIDPTLPQHCTEAAELMAVDGATSGAAVMLRPCRFVPIASISSMNMIAPP